FRRHESLRYKGPRLCVPLESRAPARTEGASRIACGETLGSLTEAHRHCVREGGPMRTSSYAWLGVLLSTALLCTGASRRLEAQTRLLEKDTFLDMESVDDP